MGRNRRYRVAIVDNDVLVARLLAQMIENDDDFTVIWKERDGQAAIDRIHHSVSGSKPLPDILLTDISMHGINGIDMSEAIRNENGEIVILGVTSYVPSLYYNEARHAGMQGVVAKERVPELITTMKRMLTEETYVVGSAHFDAPAEAHEMVAERGRPFVNLLSDAEREAIEMSSRGMSTEQMAELTGVSTSTVKTYLMRVARKFGVKTRREAEAIWTDRVRH